MEVVGAAVVCTVCAAELCICAVVGGAAGWVRKGVQAADSRVLRFLCFYTLLMLVTYSAIPYKTPWCVLGFLHGMILLAGAGAAFSEAFWTRRVSARCFAASSFK